MGRALLCQAAAAERRASRTAAETVAQVPMAPPYNTVPATAEEQDQGRNIEGAVSHCLGGGPPGRAVIDHTAPNSRDVFVLWRVNSEGRFVPDAYREYFAC